jgi:hypothetical protein
MSSSSKNTNSSNIYIEDPTLIDLEEVLQFLSDEAQLPLDGLPKRWSTSTQDKHMKTPLDPKSVEDISFIDQTQGGHSVTISRLNEMKESGLLSVNARNEVIAPCFVSGEYVIVKSLEADHAQSKEDIFKRQLALIAKMNEDKDFADRLMKVPNASNLFIDTSPPNGHYKGSQFFYELYYNDINNIWLICHHCNNTKNAKEFISWIEKQWMYGKAFIDFLNDEKVHDSAILLKVGDDKKGLAETAIKWFATNQKNT